ncbi:Chemotaxis protein methyltransferase CheR [hydrothermal vent metagenome]|uniref:protein-glutamate O-methyltransferase n=1 Tax=hydrothermal vent metagenome TaxID=652676 RepID=A0A3B0ZJY9_9ZZZZ
MNGKSFNREEREFELTNRDFERLKKIVGEQTGIVLTDGKRNMVYGRLARRLRALNIDSFLHYIQLIESDEDELINFINSVTTNLTSFFRENHHFDYLRDTVLPQLLVNNQNTRKIRIWSAGCSTGEEPYSLAMTVSEFFENHPNWDVKILATDIDTKVIAQAASGIYTAERIDGLNESLIKRWFVKGKGEKNGMVKVRRELQALIDFKQLNLLHSWPMTGPFDLVFCRNVVIYFDKPTKIKLFDNYADKLVNKGHLFIGHSETLFKISDRFDSLGGTIYQKKN